MSLTFLAAFFGGLMFGALVMVAFLLYMALKEQG